VIRYIALPAATLLLLATFCNLIFTKKKFKGRAERLMEAVTENEPVIEAIIARGYSSHEVHVCVRKFYTKNPSFVPLSEEKLLELVKARKKVEKQVQEKQGRSWSKGRALAGKDLASIAKAANGALGDVSRRASSRRSGGGRGTPDQAMIAVLIDKVKVDPNDYYDAEDRRIMLQVLRFRKVHGAGLEPLCANGGGLATGGGLLAAATAAAAQGQGAAVGVPISGDELTNELMRLRAENALLREKLGDHGHSVGDRETTRAQSRRDRHDSAVAHRAQSPWENHAHTTAKNNQRHVQEAVAQGYTRDFVQSVMQNFYEDNADRVHTEIYLDELEVEIFKAMKLLPRKLNARTIEFLITKKKVPEKIVIACVRHHYISQPNELKACKPVPKKTMQQLLALAAKGSLPKEDGDAWWEIDPDNDDGVIGPNPESKQNSRNTTPAPDHLPSVSEAADGAEQAPAAPPAVAAVATEEDPMMSSGVDGGQTQPDVPGGRQAPMAKVEEGSAGEAAPADEDAPERADPTPALIDGGGGLPAAVTATDETKPSPRAEEEEALSDHYNAPENQPSTQEAEPPKGDAGSEEPHHHQRKHHSHGSRKHLHGSRKHLHGSSKKLEADISSEEEKAAAAVRIQARYRGKAAQRRVEEIRKDRAGRDGKDGKDGKDDKDRKERSRDGRESREGKERSKDSKGRRGRHGRDRDDDSAVIFSNVSADNLANVDEATRSGAGASDPYVRWLDPKRKRVAKTGVIKDAMGHSGTSKPEWAGETFNGKLRVPAPGATLIVEVVDYSRDGIDVSLGRAWFEVPDDLGEAHQLEQSYVLPLQEVPDGRASEVSFTLKLKPRHESDGTSSSSSDEDEKKGRGGKKRDKERPKSRERERPDSAQGGGGTEPGERPASAQSGGSGGGGGGGTDRRRRQSSSPGAESNRAAGGVPNRRSSSRERERDGEGEVPPRANSPQRDSQDEGGGDKREKRDGTPRKSSNVRSSSREGEGGTRQPSEGGERERKKDRSKTPDGQLKQKSKKRTKQKMKKGDVPDAGAGEAATPGAASADEVASPAPVAPSPPAEDWQTDPLAA